MMRVRGDFDAEPDPLHSQAIPGTKDRPCGSMQAGKRDVGFRDLDVTLMI